MVIESQIRLGAVTHSYVCAALQKWRVAMHDGRTLLCPTPGICKKSP